MSKANEQIDLFETLGSIRNQYLQSQEELKKIDKQMKEELAEAERKIRASYQEKIDSSKDNCTTLRQALENHKKLLENYSTFDSKTIGETIEKLVCLVEGEDYCYQEAIHETHEYETNVWGCDSFRVRKRVSMIVKGSDKQGYYYDYEEQENEIEKLAEKNQAIVLAQTKEHKQEKIRFYTANDGTIKCLVNFHQFSYVKDFLDSVIQYRFRNNLNDVSQKELLVLMNEFILNKREIIEMNYRKRAFEKEEQLRKQLLQEQQKYQAEMAKIEVTGIPPEISSTRHNKNREIKLEESLKDNVMNHFKILYEGEEGLAKITCSEEPFISSENIFISKIAIESSIKNYFDASDPDPHFHGSMDIDLVDDGLIGIVAISSLQENPVDVMNTLQQDGYKVERITNQYLRILYLPNQGTYSHKQENMYGWVVEKPADNANDNPEKNVTSYKVEWDYLKEAEKLWMHLKEVNVLESGTEKQLKLYKDDKKMG